MRVLTNVCLVLFLSTFGVNAQSNLFNGKNLGGWEIYGSEKWYVEDGLLVSESGPDKHYGYLATSKDYDNFVLQAEFKQEADGNSGIFFRSKVEGTTISGWQVEVAPAGLHTGGIYESYARDWLVKPTPEKEETLKYGEWNTIKIKVDGDRVTTWLNGVQMIDITDEKIAEGTGKIALQIHEGGGVKVYWRNLVVSPL